MRAPLRTISLLTMANRASGLSSSPSPEEWGLSSFVQERLCLLREGWRKGWFSTIVALQTDCTNDSSFKWRKKEKLHILLYTISIKSSSSGMTSDKGHRSDLPPTTDTSSLCKSTQTNLTFLDYPFLPGCLVHLSPPGVVGVINNEEDLAPQQHQRGVGGDQALHHAVQTL